jgi:hypothetical protein
MADERAAMARRQRGAEDFFDSRGLPLASGRMTAISTAAR